MIKDKKHHTYTESYNRQKEQWFADIPSHIKAYLAKGKKIYQAEQGESNYAKLYDKGKTVPFVITPNKQNLLKMNKLPNEKK